MKQALRSLSKSYFLTSLLLCSLSLKQVAQEQSPTQKWFVVLPLRFTQIQEKPTMLSGIKLGRLIQERWCLSLSIYHSFYLKSFKATANLPGYDEQPRLFVNGMATEVGYYLLKGKRLSLEAQLLMGWGFMKYDLKKYNFSSQQVNYFAVEPSLSLEFTTGTSSSIALGLGYRPVLSKKSIVYRSSLSSGEIPIAKTFPNGLNVTVCLKGWL